MRKAWGVVALLVAVAAACGGEKKEKPRSQPGEAATEAKPAAAGQPLTLTILYGSEKKSWLDEAARAFEASGAATRSGRPIKIDGRAMGSGEAEQAILDGSIKPHVFSPASGAYLVLLNDSWLNQPSSPHSKPIAPAGEPLVLSPIVIAMWRPMAEALGWPGKSIGWADILKVSRDPRGWQTLGHPEWGAFKLGHTHPAYSNSGLLAVLAAAYAGAGKTRGLTAADVGAAKTRDFVRAVEDAIVHYGKSTGFFAEKMVERGPSYMSAAVLYENLVIESYGKNSEAGMPLVAIYPTEGTFWSDHPYSILDADWVGAEEREAAQAFLGFLKARPQQERALALGFRPSDPAIAMAAPIDAAHGVDPKQPETLLEVPDAATLRALLGLWGASKKPTDVILVFDKSGSMQGRPLAEAKEGAKAFLDGLHDRDEVSLLFFDTKAYPPTPPAALGKERAHLKARIDSTIAAGGTALYDATWAAYRAAQERARKYPARISAVVVMTDGVDEDSTMKLDELGGKFSPEHAPVKIFTIAYGSKTDDGVLKQIAEAAQGSSVKGTAENIVSVYRDLSAFF